MTPHAAAHPLPYDDRMDAFLDIANGGPDRVPGDLQIADPRAFVATLFLALSTRPIARPHMNTVMDVLFALPAFAPLLVDPVVAQADIANAIHLQALPPLFQAHWRHIIVPAWRQYVGVGGGNNSDSDSDR